MVEVIVYSSFLQGLFEPKGGGYFERYFLSTALPYYQEGDKLGARSDNNSLVSVVHLRRIILKSSNNETFLSGVVSNVATLAEFRNRGVSRELLTQTIDKMEHEGFDLCMLGTGCSRHYLLLDWKPVRTRIQYVINISNNITLPIRKASWISASSISFYD